MKRVLAVAVLLAGACGGGGGDADDEYPLLPGGGGTGANGGGNGPPSDASSDATDAVDATAMIAARVCLVVDLRSLAPCASTGADGLMVTLGDESAVTAADGSFTIVAPAGANLSWTVTGASVVTSRAELSASREIPAILTDDYATLLLANGVVLSAGQGSLVTHVIDAAAPVVGATATASPVAQFATLYDGGSATIWDQDATGSFGAIWNTGLAVGSTTLTITPSGGTPVATDHTIADGAITFTTVDVP
jgi:hypothetical protein